MSKRSRARAYNGSNHEALISGSPALVLTMGRSCSSRSATRFSTACSGLAERGLEFLLEHRRGALDLRAELRVGPAETVTLMGPSGAGKST